MAELREERRGYRRRTCRRRRRRLRVWSWRSLWRACRQRRGSWEDQTPGASDSPTNSTVSETWRRLNWREGKGFGFGFGSAIWLEFEGEFEEGKANEGDREREVRIRHRRDATWIPTPPLGDSVNSDVSNGLRQAIFFFQYCFFFIQLNTVQCELDLLIFQFCF